MPAHLRLDFNLKPHADRQPKVDAVSGHHILRDPIEVGSLLICRCTDHERGHVLPLPSEEDDFLIDFNPRPDVEEMELRLSRD
jgi:hypothetical protein